MNTLFFVLIQLSFDLGVLSEFIDQRSQFDQRKKVQSVGKYFTDDEVCSFCIACLCVFEELFSAW